MKVYDSRDLMSSSSSGSDVNSGSDIDSDSGQVKPLPPTAMNRLRLPAIRGGTTRKGLEHASAALAACRDSGVKVRLFVTNDAMRVKVR